MKHAVLVALVGALLLPSAAEAHKHRHHARPARHRVTREWRGTRTQALAIAEQKAEALWGAKPCGGAWSVEFVGEAQLRAATGVTVEVLIEGASGWNSPTGEGVYTSPPSTWTSCLTELDIERWPEVSPRPLNHFTDWTAICSSVLHEAGLLTGHGELEQAWHAEPEYEPPGMTPEQLAVMRQGGLYDEARCGSEP